MSDQSVKQQIADKLKDVDNILITVNSNPSVDELSAALGFTLLVNKIDKHGTAVFSGDIPPAITFLDPAKTFENTVDSLRDFIIALDKEKADHLRYKVDGDLVKIFITPYRTTIDDKDLDFSQGDYNVEMVVAIGVKDSNDLDRALSDHGRIMHDATVASLSVGDNSSDLGSLNWHESDASSYSEMLAELAESIRNDKNLIDEQIATAFLTGIVAATDRFSNDHTSSRSMTVAAQLMAAGANQQLIATKLEEANEIESKQSDEHAESKSQGTDDPSKLKLTRDQPGAKSSSQDSKKKSKNKSTSDKAEPVKDRPAADGTMTISHSEKPGHDAKSDTPIGQEDIKSNSVPEVDRDTSADSELAEQLARSSHAVSESDIPSVSDLQKDLQAAAEELDDTPVEDSRPRDMTLPEPVSAPQQQASTDPQMPQFEPTLGGTLNATTDQAAEDKRRQEASDRNKTILSHDGSSYAASAPSDYPSVNSYSSSVSSEPKSVDPLANDTGSSHARSIDPVSPALNSEPTLADIDRQNRGHVPSSDAQAAVNEALNSAASTSEQQQHVPNIPQPSTNTQGAPSSSGTPASDLPPLPPMPPMPDFSTLPPLPSVQTVDPGSQSLPSLTPQNMSQPPAQQPPAQPSDPGQFQIPGQQ